MMLKRRDFMLAGTSALAMPMMAWTGLPQGLALCLAVDVSGSVDERRFKLQREGYARAIINPLVLRAIASVPMGRIGVSYFEWAGPGQQQVIVPWTEVDGEQSALVVSEFLINTPRPFQGSTSVTSGLRFAQRMLAEAPFSAARQVVDISGDGKDDAENFAGSVGPFTRDMRDVLVQNDITINGLPIPEGSEADTIVEWYQDNVVGGTGAFCMPALNYDSLVHAIRNKMIMEIANA